MKLREKLDTIRKIAICYYSNNDQLIKLIEEFINKLTPIKRIYEEDGVSYSDECVIPGRLVFVCTILDSVNKKYDKKQSIDRSKLHEIHLNTGELWGKYVNNVHDLLNLIYQSVEEGVIKKVYLFGSYAYDGISESDGLNILVIIDDSFDVIIEYLKILIYKTVRNPTPWLLKVKTESMFNDGLMINDDSNENLIVKKGILLYG